MPAPAAFCWSRSCPASADSSDHLLDMRNRGIRRDAVAEIENKRSRRKCLEHRVDRGIERLPAGDQHQRIEVALHGDAALDALARKVLVDHPVKPDRIE